MIDRIWSFDVPWSVHCSPVSASCVGPSAKHPRGNVGQWIALFRIEEYTNAVDKLSFCVDSGGRGAVAGESLYSDGFQHQDHSQCRGGGCGWSFRIEVCGTLGRRYQFSNRALTLSVRFPYEGTRQKV